MVLPNLTRPSTGATLPISTPDTPSVAALGRLGRGNAWRTAAMRSYGRPVLFWTTRGQGRFTYAGRRRGFGPFTLLFLPSGTMHGFELVGPVTGSLVFLPADPALPWPDAPLFLRLQDPTRQAELTRQIATIDEETRSSDPESGAALGYLCGLLAVWMRRVMADGAQPAPRRRDLAAAYAELVEREYRTGGGVEELARKLGVTASHLTRACRRSSGRSAHDILAERRHFEARRLLLDSDHPVAEVARQAGFSSPAYFTRAFRTATGQTPSAFRRTGGAG